MRLAFIRAGRLQAIARKKMKSLENPKILYPNRESPLRWNPIFRGKSVFQLQWPRKGCQVFSSAGSKAPPAAAPEPNRKMD